MAKEMKHKNLLSGKAGVPIDFSKKDYSVRIKEISNGFVVCETWFEEKKKKGKMDDEGDDDGNVSCGGIYKDKETYYKTKEEISKLNIKV